MRAKQFKNRLCTTVLYLTQIQNYQSLKWSCKTIEANFPLRDHSNIAQKKQAKTRDISVKA